MTDSTASPSIATVLAFSFASAALLSIVRRVATTTLRPSRRLPEKYVNRINELDKRVCFLLLHFFKEMRYPLSSLMINGGYVRDLLLARHADDLDISVCLRQCPTLTVQKILDDLAAFDHLNRYGFQSIKVASIIGDASKDKNLDTAKAVLVSHEGERIEVDLMPTIGDEVYDEVNRVPIRDHRGTPRQDALRRDLTIGAMFIRVSLSPRNPSNMDFVFIDFFGGLQDLRQRILRSPCPTPALQLSWWAKVLKDDPVRIIRVLRFAAKLDFRIHKAFWEAMPQAMDHLKAKVAGSRKLDELLKIAKLGIDKTVSMIALAFCHQGLAAAVLGGKDAKSIPHFLPDVLKFEEQRFKDITCRVMLDPKSPEKLLGSCIALSVFCATFDEDLKASVKHGHRETFLLQQSRFFEACAGLCVSRHSKQAGMYLFDAAIDIVVGVDERFAKLDETFAKHTKSDKSLPSGLDFGFCLLMWTALKLGSDAQSYQHDVVCAMLPEELVDKAKTALALLKRMKVVSASGNDLVKATQIPSHLRGALLVRLNVLGRINGAKPDISSGSSPLFVDIVDELYSDGEIKPAYAPDPKPNKSKSKQDSKPKDSTASGPKSKTQAKSKEKTNTKTKTKSKSKKKTKPKPQ